MPRERAPYNPPMSVVALPRPADTIVAPMPEPQRRALPNLRRKAVINTHEAVRLIPADRKGGQERGGRNVSDGIIGLQKIAFGERTLRGRLVRRRRVTGG
jgi:hypothetical protein